MLLEHNKEAYAATKAMLLEHRECCLVAATGIGKSNIATELIQELNLNALIIAPRASIRDNWADMPDKYNFTPTISTMTYQYFIKHYDELYGFDAYIFDEAHHTGAPKWGKAIKKFREGLDTEFVLGLTADPNRYSDKSKRDKEDKIVTTVVKSVFNDHAVYGHDQRSAIKNGILPRATYVCSIYNVDEMFDKYEAMDLTEELRGRLNYTRTNCEAIEDTLRRNIPKGVPVKGIVFVDSINNIDIGVRLARRAFPKEAVHYIHSKLSTIENVETLEMFRNAKSGFIVSVDMIGEGLHIDGINTVIMLRKTGSPTIYTQQIGRGLAANSNNVTIFDFVRNDTSIKRVLARIKNIKEYYEIEEDEETDSKEDIDSDNHDNHHRYPNISDQFIVKDKASDILEIFNEIDDYNRGKYSRWTKKEDQIIIDNYPTMGVDVKKLLHGRTEAACRYRARFLNICKPSRIWTEKEDQILRDNYPTMKGDVVKLLPGRTRDTCYARASCIINKTKKIQSKNWTEKEDQILRDNYPNIGLEVLELLPDRTQAAILNRVVKLGLAVRQRRWTEKEDQILRDNYPTMGGDVEKLLPGRTIVDVRQRISILKIKYNNANKRWTKEEDQILRDNYPTMGLNVVNLLPGRSRRSILAYTNRFGIRRDKNQ